jgi:hypothetical protein
MIRSLSPLDYKYVTGGSCMSRSCRWEIVMLGLTCIFVGSSFHGSANTHLSVSTRLTRPCRHVWRIDSLSACWYNIKLIGNQSTTSYGYPTCQEPIPELNSHQGCGLDESFFERKQEGISPTVILLIKRKNCTKYLQGWQPLCHISHKAGLSSMYT